MYSDVIEDVVIGDLFDGTSVTPTYDDNGNLTKDADMGVAPDPAGGPMGYHAAPMETGTLEQIIEELAPTPEVPPDELQYEPFPTEEQMMPDPWMMPGM